MDVCASLSMRFRLSLMLSILLLIALVGNAEAQGDWWSQDWTNGDWWSQDKPAQESPAQGDWWSRNWPQDGWWSPQSPAPTSPAQESPAQQSPAPESPAQESPAQQSPAPESPAQQSPSPGQGGWRKGRATFYGSPHSGSCGYGHLDENRNTGYNLAAIPDVHPDFHGSCGLCYEIKCEPGSFTDYYGETLDRNTACYDPDKTVTIAIVDSCPCNGNQRWCCGDMDHLDIVDVVYDQLADRKWGVIGLQYRPVPCPDPSYLERRNHYGDGGRKLKSVSHKVHDGVDMMIGNDGF